MVRFLRGRASMYARVLNWCDKERPSVAYQYTLTKTTNNYTQMCQT